MRSHARATGVPGPCMAVPSQCDTAVQRKVKGATGHGGAGSCRKGTQGDWGGPRAGYEVHRRQRHIGFTKGQGEAAWHLPVGLGMNGGGAVASRCRGEAMQSR